MIISGQVFSFSTLNADDLDRMEIAQEHLQQASATEEQRPKAKMGDYVRGQCRLVMDYLDEVLGAGAAKRLGLTGSDFGACKEAVEAFKSAIEAEKTPTAPQNRAQRRAQEKHGKAKPVIRYPQQEGAMSATQAAEIAARPDAARMVERVDKAARREQLLAELAALDNA